MWVPALSLALFLGVLLLDLLTPQRLVAAILMGVPIALSGLALRPRLTQGLVLLALISDGLAAWLNALRSGGLDELSLANRALAGLSILVVGWLTLSLQQRAEQAGEAMEAARRAEQEARIRRALGELEGGLAPEELLQQALVRLNELLSASGGLLLEKSEPPRCLAQIPSQLEGPDLQEAIPGWVHLALRAEEPTLLPLRIPIHLSGLPLPVERVLAFPLKNHQLLLFNPQLQESLEVARRIHGQLVALVQRARTHALLRDLAYTLSHDLRTPLTANLLNLRLALSGAYGPTSPELKEALRNGIEANQGLLRLADNLLRLSLYETSGPSPLQILELAPLVRRVASTLRPLFDEKRVSLQLQLVPSGQILGDPDDLERALTHLLENALRYSSPGSTVEVRLEAAPGILRLRVLDQGPGVPPDREELLFRRIRQGRLGEGTGLGLYLTRLIADRHRGRVGYRRRPEGGSEFFLEFPEVIHERAGLPG
jgi:signal transduction histidine kinase